MSSDQPGRVKPRINGRRRHPAWALALSAASFAHAQPRITGDVQWLLPAYQASGKLDGPRDRALLDAVEAMVVLPGNELLIASTPPADGLVLRTVSAEGAVTTLAAIPPDKLRLATLQVQPDQESSAFYALAAGQDHQTLYEVSRDGAIRPLAGAADAEFGALQTYERYEAFAGNTRDGFWFLNRTRGSVRYLNRGSPPSDIAIDVDVPDWHATSASMIAAATDRSFWLVSDLGEVIRVGPERQVQARFHLLSGKTNDPAIELFRHAKMVSHQVLREMRQSGVPLVFDPDASANNRYVSYTARIPVGDGTGAMRWIWAANAIVSPWGAYDGPGVTVTCSPKPGG
jgi:hypothetical protein